MAKKLIAIGAVALLAAVGIFSMMPGRTNAAAGDSSKEEKKGLAIGDAAPAWEELEGIDGKKHSLEDLKKAKAVVVVFTCNGCPVAKAYEDRLVELQKEYAEKDISLVAINVSDELPAMKDRAEEKGFEFEYLNDPSQEIGRKFGATTTPHAFVLNGDRKVVYMGAVDDEMDASKVSHHYVRDAVHDILAGNAPRVAKTKPSGCGIHYD